MPQWCWAARRTVRSRCWRASLTAPSSAGCRRPTWFGKRPRWSAAGEGAVTRWRRPAAGPPAAWTRRCRWPARRSSAASGRNRPGQPMRVLAIDHGSARAGCAISDPTGTIARPLGVIEPPEPRAIAELATEQEADLVVVGLPVSLSGVEGTQAAEARAFRDALDAMLDVPV